MSETPQIPIPLNNYWKLLMERRKPYYEWIQFIIKDAEEYRRSFPYKELSNEAYYIINPRRLKEKMEEVVPSKKLTPINLSRTVLAALYGKRLKKMKIII